MLRKCNRLLAHILAFALVITTFGSDLTSANVFAEASEEQADAPAVDAPAQNEEPVKEEPKAEEPVEKTPDEEVEEPSEDKTVVDILDELKKLGVELTVYDPHADENEVKMEYDISLAENYDGKYDAMLFAVAHDEFKGMSLDEMRKLSKNKPIIIDLKSIFRFKNESPDEISYWSL